MNAAQRLKLRAIAIRKRLREIGSLPADDFTEEVSGESRTLMSELDDIEAREAALAAGEEGVDDPVAVADEDAETREIRSLIGKASISRFVAKALDNEEFDGAEKELRDAFDLSGNTVPWAALLSESDLETRDDAISALGGPFGVNQQAIISRLFARSATAALGVTMPSVPVGSRQYPIITGGTSAEFKAPAAAIEAGALTISTKTVTPTRIGARYRFRQEDAVTLAGLENAMRQDIRRVMSDGLDRAVLNGDGVAPNIAGFLCTPANGGLPALADPTDVATFQTYVDTSVAGVDGYYANTSSDCRFVINPTVYSHAARTFQAGTAVAAGSYVSDRVGAWHSTAMVAKGTNIQECLMARGTNLNTAVLPVWRGLSMIRDEITDAARAVVNMTIYALFGFAILRPDGFKRVKFKTS